MLQGRIPQFSNADKPIYVDVYETKKRTPLWEMAFVTIWLIVTFVPIPGVSVIRYACVIGFVALTAIDRNTVIPILLKSWPVFTVPILGFFSIGWSPYPDDAIREAMLMFLTPFVVVVMSSRLSTLEVLRCMTVAAMVGLIYVTPYFATFELGEPYAGKNFFAIHMLFVMILCLAMALNSEEHILMRLLAVPFVPIAFFYQFLANSATSMVFAVVGSVALIGVKLIWTSFGKIRHMRTVTFLLVVTMVLTGTITVLANPEADFVTEFFELVGKDSTFTGRTEIWHAAAAVSKEHPWLGLGLEGFWQYDVGTAQTLNENDHKEFGTKLSFHNAYWEVRVHLGLIGLALFIYQFYWCYSRALMSWLRESNMTNSTLVITISVVLISTFTESYAYGTFNTLANLLVLGGMSGFMVGKRKHVARLPLTANVAA